MSLEVVVTAEFEEVMLRKWSDNWRTELEVSDILPLTVKVSAIHGVKGSVDFNGYEYFYLGTSANGTKVFLQKGLEDVYEAHLVSGGLLLVFNERLFQHADPHE